MNSESIYRRAGGRRHYNSVRQMRALNRQMLLVELMSKLDILERGWQTKAAEILDVSKATITRDLKAIHAYWIQKCKDDSSKQSPKPEPLSEVRIEELRDLHHNPPPPPPKRQSLQENAGEKSAIEKLCELKKLIHGEPSPDEYQTKRISKGWGTLVSKLHAPVAPADPGYRFL